MHFLGLDGGAKLPEWWLGRPPPTSVGTSLSEVTLSLLARPAHAWMLRWTFLGCLLGVALTHREGYSVDMSYQGLISISPWSYICIWICDARCGELRFSLHCFSLLSWTGPEEAVSVRAWLASNMEPYPLYSTLAWQGTLCVLVIIMSVCVHAYG